MDNKRSLFCFIIQKAKDIRNSFWSSPLFDRMKKNMRIRLSDCRFYHLKMVLLDSLTYGAVRGRRLVTASYSINNIKYLKNNRCGKFQLLTDIDKGSSVLKDYFRHMLKHTNVLQAERYYFLAVHIYSLNLSLTNK